MATITTKHAALLVALADFGAQFTVIAGKYDGDEENCKYSDSFATYDEALTALDKVRDYPWSRLEVSHPELSALRMEKLRTARPAPLTKPEPLSYTSYYDYVAACRVYARKAGHRVATYVSVAQWNKLVGEALYAA